MNIFTNSAVRLVHVFERVSVLQGGRLCEANALARKVGGGGVYLGQDRSAVHEGEKTKHKQQHRNAFTRLPIVGFAWRMGSVVDLAV